MPGCVSVVIPLYNEQDSVDALVMRLGALSAPGVKWQFVFVNDGSRDSTRDRLLGKVSALADWKFLQLSRNFGQQAAYRAGLGAADGDAVVFLDADLQDPPELIPEMVACWQSGAKVVVGCRRSRSETGLRRALFDLFHVIFHRVTGGVMPKDSGTFGLMDRTVVEQLKQMPELNLFLPALRSWVGFRQEIVWYDRAERAGQPKQTLHKLFSYAWNGITSFSTVPLKVISLLGLFIFACGFAYAGILIVARILQFFGYLQWLAVLGFTTVAVAVLCLGGLQLFCLGIIGEYIAKIYTETKRRPSFIVEELIASSAHVPEQRSNSGYHSS